MSGTGVQDPITNQLSEHAHDNNLSSDNVGNPTYRKPLSEQSTNIVPEKATASKKEQLTKPKKQDSTSKGKEKAHEENTAEDEVVLLTDEERIRIYKKKNHWDRALYGGLYWDDDLKTWEAQEDVLEDHSFVLRGFAAEVADEGDDNETVIAKLKAAGGWFGDLTLRGEETKTVPIYDTCIRLKEKITDFLGKDNKKPENLGVLRSNAGENITYPLKKGDFASAIGSKTASLNGFMKKQGVMGGAENGTYVGAYCFFEKKRLWEGAEKSEAREACEEAWWPKGLRLRDSNRGETYVVGADIETVTSYIDEDTGEVSNTFER